MNREGRVFEYVITDGPGTLIMHGVARGLSALRTDMEDIAIDAIQDGHSMQFEPCDDDCETGK